MGPNIETSITSDQPPFKAIMVAGSYNSKCKPNLASCPAGHEMKICKGGFYCEQCSDSTYQPNSNKYGDQCRLRRKCLQPFMEYKSHGSTIQDSDCACVTGYHFENEDQRACVPNRECEKGFGQGEYGICEDCLAKNMYSDTVDRSQKCKPLKNCEKESRCTIKKSNGTFDNVCGPVMNDIVNCDNLTTEKPRNEEGNGAGIIAGSVVACLVVFIIIAFIYYFCFHRPRSRSNKKRPLTKEQLDSILNRIIQNAAKDETYCRKALNTSMPVIESRIDRQIWSLAQELFRKHFQAGKYEVVVEKYKGSQPKLAVTGYLQEWRSWRGEKAQSIAELFDCLKTCGREDIVYEIANQLHIEGETIEIPDKMSDKGDSLQKQKPSTMCALLRNVFPCIVNKRRYIDEERSEKTETMNRLLDSEGELHPPQTTVLSSNPAGVASEYRGPSPSAPVLEEVGVEKYSDQTYFQPKPESYPIQASS